MRTLAADIRASVTTVAAAYRLLSRRNLISSQVGRGSFVTAPSNLAADGRHHTEYGKGPRAAEYSSPLTPWRRTALAISAARLRHLYPNAMDCTTGSPDPSLLPWAVLRRKWVETLEHTQNADLQYSGPEPVEDLVRALVPRLTADAIPCRDSDLIIGSSAQQLMRLVLEVTSQMSGQRHLAVAVEEPGYPTALDIFERCGCRLLRVEVDEQGAVPDSLEGALAAGAAAVLLTPRAQNPTGACWSTSRLHALADVLSKFPGVTILEDDHFADIASAHPGSLLSDPRIDDRVVYIRSFSKAFGPDLRLAAAVLRARLKGLVIEAKKCIDGWTSRIAQRAFAAAVLDDEMQERLLLAQKTYAERRLRAAEGLSTDCGTAPRIHTWGEDGVNLWVRLPSGLDAAQVVERVAALGALIVPGEPFFVRPGQREFVRLSVGTVCSSLAYDAGRLVAGAASHPVDTGSTAPI